MDAPSLSRRRSAYEPTMQNLRMHDGEVASAQTACTRGQKKGPPHPASPSLTRYFSVQRSRLTDRTGSTQRRNAESHFASDKLKTKTLSPMQRLIAPTALLVGLAMPELPKVPS